jgi:hypothetical protein
VVGTFSLFKEFPNLVVVEALAAEGPRLNLVRGNGSGLRSNVQTGTENAVYDLLEGFAGPAGFLPELGGHIVVEG